LECENPFGLRDYDYVTICDHVEFVGMNLLISGSKMTFIRDYQLSSRQVCCGVSNENTTGDIRFKYGPLPILAFEETAVSCHEALLVMNYAVPNYL
jgi:hypothetical protein